jgi:hypothetical protein
MAGQTNPRPASDLVAVLSPLTRDIWIDRSQIVIVPKSRSRKFENCVGASHNRAVHAKENETTIITVSVTRLSFVDSPS